MEGQCQVIFAIKFNEPPTSGGGIGSRTPVFLWYDYCRAAFSSVGGCFGIFVAGAEGLGIVGGFVRASAAVGT